MKLPATLGSFSFQFFPLWCFMTRVYDCLALHDVHEDLSASELKRIFAVDRLQDVPPYDIIHPENWSHNSRVKRHTGSPSNKKLELKFAAWKANYHLSLEPINLISPNIVSVVRDGNNSRVYNGRLPAESSCHYRGHALSHGNASVAMSYCNQNMRGAVMLPDCFLLIQPLPDRFHNETHQPHFVYKRSTSLTLDYAIGKHSAGHGVLKPLGEEEFCFAMPNENYTLPEDDGKPEISFSLDSADERVDLELAVFLDKKLWEKFLTDFGTDRAEKELVDFSLALLNNVYMTYQQESMSPKLEIAIVRFELWKVQPGTLPDAGHKNGHAQLFLDQFCAYQGNQNPGSDLDTPFHWDHATMLTGHDIYHTTSSVAGVAPVARMCDPMFSCSLVEGLHLGRAFVLAHEMGHNLGMVHDGAQNTCSSKCCLMSPVNGAGKTTWSTCSVNEFKHYLKTMGSLGVAKNCLLDRAIPDPTRNHKTDPRLPGQRFTADQQCAFFWGRDYTQDIPLGKTIEDNCDIIWCGNGGTSISTSHPALEGTWCGQSNWCRDGKCQPWPVEDAPRPVNGTWSDWVSVDNGICSVCHVEGGIRIRQDQRFCDNPAPNNGGKPCSGVSRRGMLCDTGLTTCSGFKKKEYADGLCASFRNDPNNPDAELTGISYDHPDTRCKVWCHLSKSDLIRVKANFPDGTPCGKRQYCVNGLCLSLNCSDKSVVQDENDCPPGPKIFSDWTAWSSCSSSCGPGIRNRWRICTRGATNDTCTGDREEKQDCQGESLCPTWEVWTAWSECGVSCGSGQKSRKRSCNPAGLNQCIGSKDEYATCYAGDCPIVTWLTWESWTRCSVECGGGKQRRVRVCTGGGPCYGNSTEERDCNTHSCYFWGTWGNWSPCTKSCGFGLRQRVQQCQNNQGFLATGTYCAGQNITEQESCNAQTCPSYGGWSPWSYCSESCGPYGYQTRRRICIHGAADSCDGPNRQERGCTGNPPCVEGWLLWSAWSPCTLTCGGGIQRRTRQCSASVDRALNCPGVDTEVLDCNIGACPTWSAWSEWDLCTTTCGNGTQTRVRKCRGSDAPGLVVGGQQFVSFSSQLDSERICDGSMVETRTCDALPPCDGQWDNWESWSLCSTTCGGGTRLRRRQCSSRTFCVGSSLEADACNTQECLSTGSGVWGAWSEYSQCSASCGGGKQSRSRECEGSGLYVCPGFAREELSCNQQPCDLGSLDTNTAQNTGALIYILPTWAPYSPWSECSCYTMQRVRRRHCQVQMPQLMGYCLGSLLDEEKCTPTSTCEQINGGWSDWGQWSGCSDCGKKSEQFRYRTCTNPYPINRGAYCLGKAFEQRPCPDALPCAGAPVNGNWSPWTPWSQCSSSCERGFRGRTRYCNTPLPLNGGARCKGNDFELEPCTSDVTCQSKVDGEWNSWSAWVPCARDCGFAFQTRNRFCNNPTPQNGGQRCRALAYNSRVCSLPKCRNAIDGGWGPWQPWSTCSANCGYGLQTRTRTCDNPVPKNGGLPCLSISTDIQSCVSNAQECTNQLSHEETFEEIMRQWEQYTV